MASGLTMDNVFLSRSMWAGDGKVLQQPPDLYTSVVVTRHIPAGSSFGPCVLHNTFYDTIAFIAQKSCDKRTKSYVFRVDPEAMRTSALVLSWLRLVQAARNREEQNTEAYLRGGQLFVRTTRDVRPEEELLVWYDQELSHLLGFTDLTSRRHPDELKCAKCNQVFKHEHPFLAHCRFLCAHIKTEAWSRETHELKRMEMKRQNRVTDFHNIARDLEHKKPGNNEDAEISPRKRKGEDIIFTKGRKSVLLEKTNITNDDNITHLTRDYPSTTPEEPISLKADKVKNEHSECKTGVFTEVGQSKRTFTHDKESPAEADSEGETAEGSGLRQNASSAFSLVLSGGQGEQKSAFCKPCKRSPPHGSTAHPSTAPSVPPNRLEDIADAFTPRTVLGYGNLLTPSMLSSEVQGGQTVPAPATLPGGFHYGPEYWPRSISAQLQSTSSLTILPPTFTSFGVSVQNWCAKCNLSFRMTSDLVFHMRSHHKKEFAAESQVRRRREEKLTCPICHEYFRERHHLSRHMTSHN